MLKFIKKLTPQDKFISTFILKGVGLYLLWFLLYDNWLLKDGWADHFLIDHLVKSTAFLLQLLGYTIFSYADAVGIDGTHGVLIGVPCNGLSLFALFAGFIIIFPGKMKYKLFFIPIGIFIIHIINIFRLVGLALVVQYQPESLEFNHKYTFTVIVYALIFSLWILWVNKFSTKK
ncbi:MAG: exosortase/archaeosortase family protein [Flavobacteriales bacterium CG_4_9_14_3_um_filter_32_8]|nr:MAG: exosortase/archaeosortase family protein [Flavobacteriales bacterium CG_4_9_14_3_um_filter_32_8]